MILKLEADGNDSVPVDMAYAPTIYQPSNFNTVVSNTQNVRNYNNGQYQMYVSSIKTNADNFVTYLNSNGSYSKVIGVALYVTDIERS